MRRCGKMLTLLTAGVLSLSLVAPFTSFAAEETGECSIGEPPVKEETNIGEPPIAAEMPELPPAIAMTPDGEVIYSPEEMPDFIIEKPIEPPVVEEEIPVVGGRSERIGYLKCRRSFDFGLDKPLWEFAQYLIDNEGWDPNGWIYELLAEAYPDEDPYPTPEPVDPEAPTPDFDFRQERIGYIKAMRDMEFGEGTLEEFATWMIGEMDWEEDMLWDFLYEAYPEESQRTARWLSENRCGLQQPEVVIDPDPQWLAENRCGLQPSDKVEMETNYETQGAQADTTSPEYSILDDPTTEYIVARGDSLWIIAEKIYGDGRWWVIIAGANADQVHNPRTIYAGQTLIIPNVDFSR